MDDVREEEVSGVLPLRVPLEQRVDGGRRQGVLQEGLGHDAHGRILDKPLKDIAVDHGRPLA
ncbi:MAG: hypothetical protein ACR2MC_09560 [Actinomycetota bacterium]